MCVYLACGLPGAPSPEDETRVGRDDLKIENSAYCDGLCFAKRQESERKRG